MIKKRGFIIGIFLLIFLFTSPVWSWQLKGKEELNVLIFDKTVPDQTYREHKGLVWLLNHLKLKQTDGSAYDLKEDYVGFVPSSNPPEFSIRELPEDLSSYDVLYMADGYGVYQDEYVEKSVAGNRSELLYGGMTADEVNKLRASLIENNQTLIAEFNTFGSPTKQDVREGFYDLLNVQWTGWMGRYFVDLQSNEVPGWLKQNYEEQYQKDFDLKGSGLVFVNEADEVIVLPGENLPSKPVTFHVTDVALEQYDVKREIAYNYWFDVVDAYNPEEIQASFKLNLSEEGEKIVAENGIPLTFPAMVHHENSSYRSYYFAGDFADQEKVPGVHQISGIPWVHKLFAFEKEGRTDTFFWEAYVPIMKEILTNMEKPIDNKKHVDIEVKTEDDIQYTGKTGEQYIQVYENGEWEDLLIKGVNMGIAKPGSFPGETSITRAEYARWFEQIGNMNANAIRVYTIHPPAFYQALYEYNLNNETPIYLFHGVWVKEEVFVDKQNAYDPEVMEDFQAEIKKTVDIIHGNADIEERAGHASGAYVHDISPYVLGWMLGIEWDPGAVVGTNEKNKGITGFDGKYFMTENGSPFESWLAEMMDYTATYEAKTYEWQRLMSFTNWVTTDLLTHPAEPDEDEDMVSVNPNVIKAKESFYPGQFASYHIYPYYPDFLNYEEEYVEYVDHRGEKNNYAGYIHDMKQNHDMPLLVAEFGIPASRGLTHENVYGFDQGNHSEQEQGQQLSQLFEDIVEEDLAGGLVFSWQDEWFKRTWNTMDYDNPDRRPFWDNIQTNEQHFGLLSFDPGKKGKTFRVDGDTADWEANDKVPLNQVTAEDSPIEKVFLASDEKALYVRIDYDESKWNPDNMQTSILLNTIQNQGQSTIPGVSGLTEKGIDFLVNLNGKKNSSVLVDSYYDTFYYHYGEKLSMIQTKDYADEKNNGVYHPIRLTLNKALEINKAEGTQTIPFSAYETGELHYGNGNPESEEFNSLADFYMKDGVLELRLPWLLINVKDPSQKQIMGNIWSEEGLASSETIDHLSAKVVMTNKENGVIQKLPSGEDEWFEYGWDTWQEPVYHERLKQSYKILKNTFGEYSLEN
ncbi:hypothetical protein [Aquibacillus kalidii]|uniref:hypothetical protein n=1 Tax=Aquibacillus kalidii TaxID=2762597 RepID=UPI001646740D|nr:hypothetical protein [Aquibacillus kalidii]